MIIGNEINSIIVRCYFSSNSLYFEIRWKYCVVIIVYAFAADKIKQANYLFIQIKSICQLKCFQNTYFVGRDENQL